MEEYEYEEENLDDFMVNASTIISEENNPDKETMIESLKQHLISIFDNQTEMQNFLKTLNLVIFNENSSKILHLQVFKLYPIIFSFNPNSSFYYIDFFLFSINQSISEENRDNFAYISIIFSEVIISFFANEKDNKNLIKKNYILDNNKKYKLYEKLLNFCNEKIKTNKKTEQSFGCLLLTELIEKCPIVKEEKILDNLFKLISNYLEDRWFECKLDLLNCTISLIFISESKFKPYANICLFRVLDYLTDEEWMKRKLAINIVYTLVFYCKEEIMAVKDNIVEFLNTLKDDPVEEVREVCIQTLKFIEENESIDGQKDNNGNAQATEIDNQNKEQILNPVQNINKKENLNEDLNENKNINQSENLNENKNINQNENLNENKNINQNENISNNKNINQIKKKKININKKITNNNNTKNNINNVRSKKEINYKNKTDEKSHKNNNIKDENNTKPLSSFKIYNNKTQTRIMMKQKANEEYLKKKLLKEKNYLEKQEKELNEKSKNNINLNINENQNQNQQKPKIFKPRPKNKTIAQLIKEFPLPDESKQNDKLNNVNENNINDNNINNEEFKTTLNGIFQQLNSIQEGQNQFMTILNNLQRTIDDNYSNLNQRISVLEDHYSVNNS